jgi:hypothetical protein
MGIAGLRNASVTDRVHRSPLALVADGLRRVSRAPAIVCGVWAVTAIVALRPAAALYRAIVGDLGSSMAASSATSGVNWTWWQEFTARQPAFAETFQPSIIGFASVLSNVSAFVAGGPPGTLIAFTGGAYVLMWIFLLGGILDRYARGRRTGAHGFFAASGVFFFRFLRLAVLAAIAWALVFGVLHGWLLDRFYHWATREVTAERTAFALYAALTLVFLLVAGAVMMVFDYAKVRAVVEDRRSMIGALLAGARFVWWHPAATAGVFLLNVLLFIVALGAYALLARGAGGNTGVTVLIGLIVAQAYILARLVVKLSFYASSVALFQDRLAHAEYTAMPQAVWPDSPAIETITEGPTGGHS